MLKMKGRKNGCNAGKMSTLLRVDRRGRLVLIPMKQALLQTDCATCLYLHFSFFARKLLHTLWREICVPPTWTFVMSPEMRDGVFNYLTSPCGDFRPRLSHKFPVNPAVFFSSCGKFVVPLHTLVTPQWLQFWAHATLGRCNGFVLKGKLQCSTCAR